MKPHIYLILMLLCLSGKLWAQTLQYRHYTVNDGLPSAIVYNIIQDKYGYVWFATENGLARFDGKNFKVYTRNDGLTDNLVLRLFEDKQGRLWVSSFTGKLCYIQDGKIHNPGNDSLLSRFPAFGVAPTVPVEDKEGVVYFGVKTSFFALKDNKLYSHLAGTPEKSEKYSVFPSKPDYFPIRIDSNSSGFNKETDGYSYIRKGYYYPSGEFKKILESGSLPMVNTIQYQKLIKGDLWFTSSDDGAFEVSGLKPGNVVVKQYLSGIVVNDVFVDTENNIWFSTTGKGVYLFTGNSKNAFRIVKSNELPQENISVLYRAKNHVIWAGAINNYLYYLNDHSVHLFYSKIRKGLTNYCYDVVGDTSGNIYFANNESLLLFKKNGAKNSGVFLHSVDVPNPDFQNGNFKGLSISSAGNVLATVPFKLLMYEPNSEPGKKHIMRIIRSVNNKRILTSFITRSGMIWAANSDGLYRVDGDKWIAYYQKNKILREPISRIAELNDGNLLITTRSKGIALFDGDSVKQVFSETDGLPSDICSRIFIDGNKIWVATAKGVAQLIYQDKTLHFVRNYTTNDGLLSNEINDVVAENDTLYIATADGLTILPEIKYVKTDPPPVYINNIQYGSSDITRANDTTLKYARDYIKFGFIGITFQQPQKVIYKYRLVGSNETWQTNSNGAVDYPALAPGDYVFEVMAKKTDSDWSLPRRFHFVINAPFWMTTWFYFLVYGLLLAGLGFAVYFASRIKRTQNEKKFALKNRMVHLEQQALSALMNPHFIFNALNSIQQYLHKNDSLSANKYLSLFAKLTRKNMEAVMKNSVSLEEELERLELYLNFEKLRFGDKLQYQINIPPDLETDEILIPPMVLQPFVENAIWHGIMPLNEGGSVIIKASKINNKKYKIEIKDTGIGIETSREQKKFQGLSHQSKGMQITIERLELWARGLNTQFDLSITQGSPESGSNPGTMVTLILPL